MNVAKRRYEMRARADSAAETGRRVIAALREVAMGRLLDEITLEDVAERAGVSPRTIIRRFGGRDGLVRAAFSQGSEEVEARRDRVAAGDVRGAVEAIFEDYERYGDSLVLLLAQERRHPELLRPLLDAGRKDHADWVERTFSPRDELHRAQLIAATDVYVWKLMRRDLGLAREPAMAATADMVARLA
jgi:AcrR family transcriptional regulator